MTDPTTPTGKRHYDRVQRVGYAWFKGEDIIANEQEAAAAERERLRQFHKRDPHHDARYCRWCARLEDPSDD